MAARNIGPVGRVDAARFAQAARIAAAVTREQPRNLLQLFVVIRIVEVDRRRGRWAALRLRPLIERSGCYRRRRIRLPSRGELGVCHLAWQDNAAARAADRPLRTGNQWGDVRSALTAPHGGKLRA
jgi:hypothetical protein